MVSDEKGCGDGFLLTRASPANTLTLQGLQSAIHGLYGRRIAAGARSQSTVSAQVDGGDHFLNRLACLLACFHLAEHVLQIFALFARPAGAP